MPLKVEIFWTKIFADYYADSYMNPSWNNVGDCSRGNEMFQVPYATSYADGQMYMISQQQHSVGLGTAALSYDNLFMNGTSRGCYLRR